MRFLSSIVEWDDKMTKVEQAYEEIPVKLKMAALAEMTPPEIEDVALTSFVVRFSHGRPTRP